MTTVTPLYIAIGRFSPTEVKVLYISEDPDQALEKARIWAEARINMLPIEQDQAFFHPDFITTGARAVSWVQQYHQPTADLELFLRSAKILVHLETRRGKTPWLTDIRNNLA